MNRSLSCMFFLSMVVASYAGAMDNEEMLDVFYLRYLANGGLSNNPVDTKQAAQFFCSTCVNEALKTNSKNGKLTAEQLESLNFKSNNNRKAHTDAFPNHKEKEVNGNICIKCNCGSSFNYTFNYSRHIRLCHTAVIKLDD